MFRIRLGMNIAVFLVLAALSIFSCQNSMAAGRHSQANLVDVKFMPLPGNKLRIKLQFDRALHVNPKSFAIKQPPQIVLDFQDINNHLKADDTKQTVNLGALNIFHVVQSGSRLRVMLRLQEKVNYSTTRNGKVVSITLAGGEAASVLSAKPRFLKSKRLPTKYCIENFDFSSIDGHTGKLVVDLSNSSIGTDIKSKSDRIVVNFLNTRLPRSLLHRYDVKAFATPVTWFKASQRGRNTRLEIMLKGRQKHFVYQIDHKLVIEVKPVDVNQAEKVSLEKKVYSGKRLSLNFQDIKVRAVLQLIAEFTGLNIVVSDSVEGNITLRLNQVPWDQALDIILRTRGLDKRQYGSVLLVAPAKEIALQEKQELSAKLEVEQLAPLASELLQLNYAKAAVIATLLKDKDTSILSNRGTVSVDERTNNLWIQDTAAKLAEVRALVKKLDVPVRQVLIEARVVMVNKDFEREIGVRFGLTRPTDLSGTLAGANQMKQGVAPADIDPLSQRLNVDLPTTITGENAASIGLALAKLGNDVLLDLELSALEVEGNGEIISTPRVITANQQAALIESGKEIPYQEATSSGATSIAFKKAVLSLQVTPQITPDNRIVLALKVNQDTATNEQVLGVPIIDTKEIRTNVLVTNGETIVLGGIYKQSKAHNVRRVPFLGRMPIIGTLFRNKNEVDDREELLIFVTPKIIEQKYKGYY